MENEKQLEAMTDHDLLVELVRQQRKSSRHGTFLVLLMVVIAAVTVAAALILVPKANRTQAEAEQLILNAQESLKEVDVMIGSIEDLSVNANTLVADNADAVTDAMEKIKNIDFDSLNASIKDLSEILEPLAKFFNLF